MGENGSTFFRSNVVDRFKARSKDQIYAKNCEIVVCYVLSVDSLRLRIFPQAHTYRATVPSYGHQA